MWRAPQMKAQATLKQALTRAPALRLPDPEKAFQLYVHEREGIALGVLTQRFGSETQPVSLLIQKNPSNGPRLAPLPLKSCSYCNHDRRYFKTLLWGQTIFTSHQVKQLLNGKGHLWMSDQRILRYQVMLMENPGLTIYPCEVLNPATLLPSPKGSLPFHSCLETLGHWTKPREGLSEDSLTNPEEIWYTDGSSLS